MGSKEENSLPEVKRAPSPSIGDINNPKDVANLYTHIRASYSDKLALSREMRAAKTQKSPDVLDPFFYDAPPKRAYPLPKDHPIFLRGAELGIDVLTDRMYKIVRSTYTKGLYTEDEVDCFVTSPSGKPPLINWDIVQEDRIPEWAKSRFFYPSGARRKHAVAGFPLPTVSPSESSQGVKPSTPDDVYYVEPEERTAEEMLPWDTSSFDHKLFIPGLHGQYNVYKNRYLDLINTVDGTITLGNMLRLAPFLELGVNADDEPRNISPVPQNALLLDALSTRAINSFLPFVNLMGANEMVYLNLPKDQADKYLRDTTSGVNFVREGWLTDEKRSPAAHRYYVAVEADGRLITHAGLSYGEWVNIGRPQTAREAAYALNLKYLGTLYQGECHRLGDGINYAANPIMAHPIAEVYSSWMATPERCPFPQVHGSVSMRDTTAHEMLSTYLHPMFYAERMRYHRWGTSVSLKGTPFYAIDGVRKSLVKLDDFQRGFGAHVQAVHKRHASAIYAPNVPTLISADGMTII